jgi:uncharacterized repeat protein (TIGR03843 family)
MTTLPPARRPCLGLTLIEVLVALAVVAITLAAGLKAAGSLANNTDRKSGHCLLAGDRVWAIDNGLCFAPDFKLRTVIWEFAGEALTPEQLAAVRMVCGEMPAEVAELIAPHEVAAAQGRARWLVDHGVLPGDETGGRYPWPLV